MKVMQVLTQKEINSFEESLKLIYEKAIRKNSYTTIEYFKGLCDGLSQGHAIIKNLIVKAATTEVSDILTRFDWKPIETAPKDNSIPLYLSTFDEYGKMIALDFNGEWSEIAWVSEMGIENPTHWSY